MKALSLGLLVLYCVEQTISKPPKHEHNFPTSPDVPFVKQMGAPEGTIWGSAIQKASKRLKEQNWTLEEKVKLGTGNGWPGGQCEANTPSIARVEFPGQCITDGPLGIRSADKVSAFPSGINAAATFDRGLMRRRAAAIGREYREKGVNVHLGPMTNIQRTPLSGRIWEGSGGDTYLAGEATFEAIKGIQSMGVQADVKHFINNEQELARGWMSTNVNDRTQHEIYLHPFLRAVQADVASVMASYNKINQTWGTENAKTLNGLLKHELGFNGYVLSDFFGSHSTVKSVNSGLDMVLPIGTNFGQNLIDAVNNGNVTMERIDDMAMRILSSWYLLGQDDKDFPQTNFDFFDLNSKHNKHIDVQHDHHTIIREVGAASHVLLKNIDSFLPLEKPRSIVLLGTDAGPAPYGPNFYHDRYIRPDDRTGVLAMGWGSGTCFFPYLIDPLQAIQAKAKETHTDLTWFLEDNMPAEAARQAVDKTVAIVFISADSGEETEDKGDRPDFKPWHNGTENVIAVANANPNTIVVVHSVGPIDMEWVDHPNVKAIVWAGIVGQEVGNALVDILWGDVNPSGRLPYTIAKNGTDYSAEITHDTDNWETPQAEYDEELLVDYKYFDEQNITPRYEFGFGLSYTNFEYDTLKVQPLSNALHGPPKGTNHSAQGSSVAAWLHEPRYIITVGVTNSGKVAGHEVPQLYIEFPKEAGEPPKLLRGFDRLYLRVSQRDEVTFSLSYYDLSIWDVVEQRWRRPEGKFKTHVGASSRDIRLSASLDQAAKQRGRPDLDNVLFVAQKGGY